MYYTEMQSSSERADRRAQRELKRWRDERDEVIRKNKNEVDGQVASFRHKMLRLNRSASLGNPARAVSSAVSNPSYMCESLLFVLSSLFRRNSVDIERINFEIRGNTLVISKVRPAVPPHTNVLMTTPKIEVRVGDMQRASSGHGSDHVCQGLCCDDERHGLTRIICPYSLTMSRMLVSKKVGIQTVLQDGTVVTNERDIMQFDPVLNRGCLWMNRVSEMDPRNELHGSQEFVVRYLDNEISGLPDVIVVLLCVLF